MIRTVRAKVTALIIGVMALFVLVFGIVSEQVGRRQLFGSIDQELRKRAEGLIMASRDIRERINGFDMPMGEGRGPGPGFGPRDGRGPGRGPGAGPGGGPGNGPGGGMGGFFRPRIDPLRSIGPRLLLPPLLIERSRERFGEVPPDQPYDREGAEAARKNGEDLRTIVIEDEPVRIISATDPLAPPDEKIVVQVPYPMGDVIRSIDNTRRVGQIVIPLGILAIGLLSLWLVDRILAPLRRIVAQASKLDGESMDQRLDVVGNDEFSLLSSTLNGMLDRLRMAFKAQEEANEKLSKNLQLQRQFTADASHELKTPLATIKAHASLAERHSEDSVESIQAIKDAADRMNRLVTGLLTLARTDGRVEGEAMVPTDLSELTQRAVGALPPEWSSSVTLELTQAPARVVPDLAARAITNLVENAFRHGEGKNVLVRTGMEGVRPYVEVSDQGPGIGPEHLPHLFERFYRADSSRSAQTGGTGLGLAIVKAIVEAHGGSVDVSSQLGKGTSFRLSFGSSAVSPGKPEA